MSDEVNRVDQALFDRRPKRVRKCPRCHGCGTIVDSYALMPSPRTDAFKLAGTPLDTLCAFVVGSFDIFEATREAVDLAKRSRRPVAFEFNEQIVLVRASDDPDAIARLWWKNAYGETPEQTFARR